MKTDGDLGDQIEALLPKSLDDIVRINRQYLTIRLATEREVLELHHEIVPNRQPVMILSDWRLVAFDMSAEGVHRIDISLLGGRPSGGVRITSPARKIDLDRQLVITHSGTLYGLGKRGEGEPPFDHVAMICAATYSWGWGAAFGIPHLFLN